MHLLFVDDVIERDNNQRIVKAAEAKGVKVLTMI